MKIGFDAKRAYHNTTGLGNYSRDLIRVLAEYYTENQYYLYNTKPKKIDRLSVYKNVFERLPNKWIWKKLSSIWRQGPVSKQIAEDKIELYHGLSGEIPRGLKEKGIKSVVTIHDLIFMHHPKLYKPIDRKIYFKKFKYAAHNVDRIIAISEQTKKDIIQFLGVDSTKIEVVYQGCHSVFKEKSNQEEKQSLKDKFNLPEQFILNVGTIEERKNLLSIVKAIKDIEIDLIVVGRKTDYFKEVESYINQHKLSNRVHFLEGLSLKELATLYQLATVFVYPSIIEGFGIPIIEALFSKTPVITTKGGVFPEAGGPNSTYVTVKDIDMLKKEITILLNDSSLRKQKADTGYEFAQKFNDDIITKQVFNVYKSVLKE
ncbi:glycosyltransferase family 4 protein [Seonamhaeicola maritimus]|uniref:glycosyltransferase family 4 protein n=1 Tax=Seonamhaeicola maritimus TaxID=2591822 RepID=UPI00249464EA|nr:glycosyltransferase family 1 protein [Seonamhaeicola maritimus]